MLNIRHNIEIIINNVRVVCFFFIQMIFMNLLAKKTSVNSNKILIVRLDAIGDFVLWLDSASALRKLYPVNKYHITLIGNKIWTDLAVDSALFDETWPLDNKKFTKNIVYRLMVLAKVRHSGFSIAMQPTYSRELMFGDSIVLASRAPERIGASGDIAHSSPHEKRISDKFYTRLIPSAQMPLMELQRNAEFVKGLGLTEFKPMLPILPVTASPPITFTEENYYVLFPGGSWAGKQWPIEKYAALAREIYQLTHWVGVVCGGSGEESLGDALVELADVPLHSWIGKTSLRELVAMIEKAKLVVGNDTSAIHIAAAVSTSAVCVLGGGQYGRFVPYVVDGETDRPLPIAVINRMECFECNWKCKFSPSLRSLIPCIAQISVAEVFEQVEKIIKEKKQL